MCCPDLSVPSHWKHLFFKGCTNFDKKYCRVAMRFTNISNQINVRVNNTFITWYVIISLSVPASPHTTPSLCSASMLHSAQHTTPGRGFSYMLHVFYFALYTKASRRSIITLRCYVLCSTRT